MTKSNCAAQTPQEGPLPLLQIKEALAFRALEGGFITPLKSFFREMDLEWGDTKTAHAELRDGKPVIQLGREFFEAEDVSTAEAVDLVMHEIMHHLFAHLLHGKDFEAAGYDSSIQGLAMDAAINAYLASVKCASFMARYYLDRGVEAFLRPQSHLAFRHGRDSWERENFYKKLSRLEASLEECLEFLKEHFSATETQKVKPLGGHGKDGGQLGKKGNEKPAPSVPGNVLDGGLFAGDEAESILGALGYGRANDGAKKSFAAVVKKITAILKKPGSQRQGMRMSRRIPAKLGRRDMLNVERGRDLFSRGEYRLREVWILPDLSGSMDKYVPFIIDLVASLKRSDIEAHVAVWADSIKEVSTADFKQRKLPGVGSGTNGEAVAKFIAEHRLSEVVIVTDNAAGDLTTKVLAKTHVCLVERSDKSGSFLDRSKVPLAQSYDLVI